MIKTPTTATYDIVLIGGGIAGLWTCNILQNLGFNCLLLDRAPLGTAQSINAQGIIHGGIKYSLQGILSTATKAIATMPERWAACIAGNGELDLRKVTVLSPCHYLWYNHSLTNKIKQVFASKALASKNYSVPTAQLPTIFQHAKFTGSIYKIDELVLDTRSLLQTLALPLGDRIHIMNDQMFWQLQYDANHRVRSLQILDRNDNTVQANIHAQFFIVTAADGNSLLQPIHSNFSATQQRPLHMICAKLPQNLSMYAHYVENGVNPEFTITTHYTASNDCIWYIGGQLAESGLNVNSAQQIAITQKRLAAAMPWLDFTGWKWHSFFINRYEMQTPNNARPDNFSVNYHHNLIQAWPTKLTFAPLVAERIVAIIHAQHGKLNTGPPLTPLTLPHSAQHHAKQYNGYIATPAWECGYAT